MGQTVGENFSETSYCFRKRSPDETNGWWPRTWLNTGVADKSLARPTSRCTLFDGENISFDASFVLCI